MSDDPRARHTYAVMQEARKERQRIASSPGFGLVFAMLGVGAILVGMCLALAHEDFTPGQNWRPFPWNEGR